MPMHERWGVFCAHPAEDFTRRWTPLDLVRWCCVPNPHRRSTYSKFHLALRDKLRLSSPATYTGLAETFRNSFFFSPDAAVGSIHDPLPNVQHSNMPMHLKCGVSSERVRVDVLTI